MPLFEDFPQDDWLYMIASVGAASPGGASLYSPSVEIRLLPIRRGKDAKKIKYLQSLLYEGATEPVRIRVPLALLPYLRIGSIAYRGNIISSGPWIEKSVTVTSKELINQLYCSKNRLDTEVRGNQYVSPMKMMEAGLRVDTQDGALLIHYYEVFRAFYAFHPILAAALGQAPWPMEAGRLFETERDEDNAEHTDVLVLKRGVPEAIAPALYLVAFSETWQEEAKRFHTSLRSGRPQEFDRLIAMPFCPAGRTFRVRGAQHPELPEVFIVYETLEVPWTGPGKIAIRREAPRSDGSISGGAGLELRFDHKARDEQIAKPFGGPVSVSSNADPYTEADPLDLPALGPRIVGEPEIHKLPPRGVARPARKTDGAPVVVHSAPPQKAPGGRTSNLCSTGQVLRSRCNRFEEAVQVAQLAVERGQLRSFEIVAPTDHPGQERGELTVWTFPSRRLSKSGRPVRAAWCFFKDSQGHSHQRTALVLRTVLADGREAYSATIEPRPGEAQQFQSLVFWAPEETREKFLRSLMEECRDRNGVWPDQCNASCGTATAVWNKWKHWSRKAKPEDKADVDIILSTGPFVAALESVGQMVVRRPKADHSTVAMKRHDLVTSAMFDFAVTRSVTPNSAFARRNSQ